MGRQTALPPTLAPRLLAREVAAAYLSISPATFDTLVSAGKMPRPRVLSDRRRAWDIRDLDLAVDSLPRDGEDVAIDDTWDDVRAP